MNYSQKSPIKSFLFLLALITALAIILLFLLNAFLAKYKIDIEDSLNRLFGQKVVVKSISYLPPFSVILNDTSVYGEALSGKSELLTIDKVKLVLSFKELIFQRKLIARDILTSSVKLDYLNFSKLLKKKSENTNLLNVILSSKQNINFVIKKTLIVLPQKDNQSQQVMFDLHARLAKGTISGSSSLRFIDINSKKNHFRIFRRKNQPLRCKFKIHSSKDIAYIDNLELYRGTFYLKLWGRLEEYFLKLDGYSYASYFFSSDFSRKPSFNIAKRFNQLFRQFKKADRIPVEKGPDLRIFDIDCGISISYPFVHIDNMTFSLNNTPFSLKGNVSLLKPMSLNIKLFSYPNEVRDPKKFKAINLEVKGAFLEKGFSGNISYDFPVISKRDSHFKHIEGDFNNLVFNLRKDKHLDVIFDKAYINYSNNIQRYGAELKYFKALFNLVDERVNLLMFKASINGGYLKGVGEFDTIKIPLHYSTNVSLEDIDLEKVELYLGYPFRVLGRLHGQINCLNFPSQANGQIVIKKGSFQDIRFLNWVADYFSLPILKQLNFEEASAYFLFDDNGLVLNNIDLQSPDVYLKGDFTRYDNDLVSGKLSLSLSRKALKTSSLGPLLKLLDRRVPSLTLDFQLSGLFNAMNFKWLESDFKNKLRAAIPDFAEKGVQKQIEAVLEPKTPKP